MTKEPQKKNQSSIQVLKTLNLLLEGDYSMAELIQKLNENEKESIFNNSVVSKYINTCRYCGIQIPKIHNKYFVTKLPFGLQLTGKEVDLIQNLKDIVEEEMPTRSRNTMKRFTEKINRYADKNLTRLEAKTINIAFEQFERALNAHRQVKLLFKNRYELSGIPVTISREKGKTFFQIFSKNRIRMIDTGRVAGVQVLDETFIGYMKEQTIMFTLKNKLAKRYEIRDNEQRLDKSNDSESITIVNSCKNEEALLSRLMRYDSQCEVNSPSTAREHIKEIINSALKNYGIE